MKVKHLIVRSRNKSCALLKEIEVPVTTIYRMGSTTATELITKRKHYIEINTAKSCGLSSNKIKSKRRFIKGHIPTAETFIVKARNTILEEEQSFLDKCSIYLNRWKHGIIAKRKNSSQGRKIAMLLTEEDCSNFADEYIGDLPNWVFERYYTYTREYRIHVTEEGCFYASRKMLVKDAQDRWHRHANNSVWINEKNPMFDKPSNWDNIVISCQHALKSLGLDIAAFDVKVQSNKKDNPKYIILESNSAPSLGEAGIEKYKKELMKLISKKNEF